MPVHNFFTDFHTATARQSVQDLANGRISAAEVHYKTICILMKIVVPNLPDSVDPVVLSLLPSAQVWAELNDIVEEMKSHMKDEKDWPKDLKASKEVIWCGTKPPLGSNPDSKCYFNEGNSGALLGYLKQRGSVDTILVEFRK